MSATTLLGTGSTVQVGSARIWWTSTGEGTPVVLVNGLGSPSLAWFRLIPRLSEQHRVIVLDNLGTGRTGVPDGPYTIARMAAAVAAVIGAAGETSVHVVGISMGGMIAQEVARSRPDLVRSLVLVATHCGVSYLQGDPLAMAAITGAASADDAERYAVMAPYLHAATTPAERIAEDVAVRGLQPTLESGYANQVAAVRTWDGRQVLPSLTVPTLVLHGAQDRLIDPACGRMLADELPDAAFVLLEDCGHQVFTDQPDAGARHVMSFLDAQDQT